jgi:ribonuclease HI
VVDHEGVDQLPLYSALFKDLQLVDQSLPGGHRTVIVAESADVKTQQNNYGELLALVAALRIAVDRFGGRAAAPGCCLVLTDSRLLVDYWSRGHVNPQTLSRMTEGKKRYIDECAFLRRALEEAGGEVRWVSGDLNKADLGYHKNNRTKKRNKREPPIKST